MAVANRRLRQPVIVVNNFSASIMPSISIIIPVAEHESCLLALLEDLAKYAPHIHEVIVVGTNACPPPTLSAKTDHEKSLDIRYLSSNRGRGLQMNTGAEHAKGDYLWFLHADSRVSASNISELEMTLKKKPDALLCFKLAFYPENSLPLKLNAFGANMRSFIFGIPFGDQGFCISRPLFEKTGAYPVCTPYGEDHLYVWKLKKMAIPVKTLQSTLLTSGRKYIDNGWLITTLLHQYLWLKQLVQVCRIKSTKRL
ncbi:MAG: glycosyltransferase [Pseudomonadales bacterium]|nr:glycosyltransferase [Pseudomonadales bacterium]